MRAVAIAALVLAVAFGAALGWPHPGKARLAEANGEALGYLLNRYAADHQGQACGDLGTLVAAADRSGYNVRVRNPYTGVIAAFDDPAIARPMTLHRGMPDEAGVVFYQAVTDGLGRIGWTIAVATEQGGLLPVQTAGVEVAADRER